MAEKQFLSTKTYVHETGLTAVFRQHRAQSHCRFLHGYALKVKFTFTAEQLDERNWVVDFGGLKGLKSFLEDHFDHTTLVAEDDPLLPQFQQMQTLGMLQLRLVPATGCESFASLIFDFAETWLLDAGFAPRCELVEVEVAEHGGNSAICRNMKFGVA